MRFILFFFMLFSLGTSYSQEHGCQVIFKDSLGYPPDRAKFAGWGIIGLPPTDCKEFKSTLKWKEIDQFSSTIGLIDYLCQVKQVGHYTLSTIIYKKDNLNLKSFCLQFFYEKKY